MIKAGSAALAQRQADGWRLSVQLRKKPVEWKPGEQAALVQQALDAGRVQSCPPAHADGMLVFNTGSTMFPTFSSRKSGAQ